MKHLNEYRDPTLVSQISQEIHATVRSDRDYRIMEFCGGHTHSLFRYGLIQLLPSNVKMLHGPGCPVCVLPIQRIDAAIAIAQRPDVVLCSYGDMLRVPGSEQMSLLKARALGADVRMVYSPADALALAESEPTLTVVFFAVGFETTTPPTAVILKEARKKGLRNLQVFCNHVLTPPAITGILDVDRDPGRSGHATIDALIGPGHVSLITGSSPYHALSEQYRVPIVISGFEPVDLLRSILLAVRQLNDGRFQAENEYSRAVNEKGNTKAQTLMQECFSLRPTFEWRGLGMLPDSALAIREEYAEYDAEKNFDLPMSTGQDNKACECPAVLTGQKRPDQCKLFGKPCTPQNPLGSCMVSSEGACAAYYQFKSH